MAKAASDKLMTRVFVSALLLMVTCLPGHAKLTKERRLLRHFDNIEARGAVKVFVVQEKRLRQATVYGDDSVLESIVTDVRGKTLVIEANNVTKYAPRLPLVRIAFTATHPVEVIVSAKELKSVTVAGEAEFTATNLTAKATGLQKKTFNVFSAGSGKIHLENLTADAVVARLESDGDVTIKGGVVERLDADLRGKGSLRAIDLPALRAHVSISGSGNAELRAENWLDAKLTGTGNLYYLGRPLNLFLQADNQGRVEAIDPEETLEAPAKEEATLPASLDKDKKDDPKTPQAKP